MDELQDDDAITFCILTLDRAPWLKRCISSIRRYCPTRYALKILCQGPPDDELNEFVSGLDEDVEVIRSSVNLGCGRGRQILSERVTSVLTMMIDDDMYLTEGSISLALRALRQNDRIGAVSMPLYDLHGRMLSLGGKKLTIRNGVIITQEEGMNSEADCMEVDILDGVALYRTEMVGSSFSWDSQMYFLEDVDRSLQIIKDGRWKQAIVPKGKLIHDRSWLGHNPGYEKKRVDGLVSRRAYKSFQAKWGLRYPPRSHLYYEIVLPILTLTRCQRLTSYYGRYIDLRSRGRMYAIEKRNRHSGDLLALAV